MSILTPKARLKLKALKKEAQTLTSNIPFVYSQGGVGKSVNYLPQVLQAAQMFLPGLIGSAKDPGTLLGSIPYLISKKFVPISARTRLPDTVLSSAAQQFGGTLGRNLAEALTGVAGSTLSGIGSAISGSVESVVTRLMKEDSVIGGADKKLLISALQTMRSVAPTLAKDYNAVKSFLREVALSGTGPDYATIKSLADAEKSLSGGRR